MKIFDSKSAPNPTVVYATDRSKATCILILCVFFYGAFHVESCLVLISRVFFFSSPV